MKKYIWLIFILFILSACYFDKPKELVLSNSAPQLQTIKANPFLNDKKEDKSSDTRVSVFISKNSDKIIIYGLDQSKPISSPFFLQGSIPTTWGENGELKGGLYTESGTLVQDISAHILPPVNLATPKTTEFESIIEYDSSNIQEGEDGYIQLRAHEPNNIDEDPEDIKIFVKLSKNIN